MLFPEIRRVILMPRLVWSGDSIPNRRGRNQAGAVSRDRSEDAAGADSALPSMLCLSRRRCTEDGIRIASRYFATVRRAISFHDGVVGQNHRGVFGIDQLLDVVTHRLGRMGLAAVGRRDRGGEEIFQL